MNLREKINENPAAAGVVAVLVILLIAFEAFRILRGPSVQPVDPSAVGKTAYFSADDGKTYFGDTDTGVSPIDHNGQPAFKAYVYNCSGKRFVQCLEKNDGGLFVKKPGGNWVPDADPAAAAIRQARCPDGGTPSPVLAQND